MAPKLSAGVSVAGAIAYQDDADPSTFHYFPAGARLAPADNLEAFSAKYWGIGDRYYSDHGSRHISSLVGATVSGQAIFDNTPAERDALRRQITDVYGVALPRLVPVQLVDTEVAATFAGHTLGQSSDALATFPAIAQVGSRAVYNVSGGRGRFAQLFAGVMAAGGAGECVASPDFGLSVNGAVQFTATPWKAHVSADLRRVWEIVRGRFPVPAQVEWFTLGGAEFERTMRDLMKAEAVEVSFIEGRADRDNPGEQLFAQGRLVFDALNAQIWAGDGLFKLEPQASPSSPPAGGGCVLPWRFAVSGAYQANYFNQAIRFERELEYEGAASRRVPSSVVLAVPVGHETERCFYDLSNPELPQVTPEKRARLADRLRAEKDKQAVVVKAASKSLAENKIGNRDYDRVMAYLQANSLSEDVESGDAQVASLSGQQRRASVQRWSRLADVGYTGILRRLA